MRWMALVVLALLSGLLCGCSRTDAVISEDSPRETVGEYSFRDDGYTISPEEPLAATAESREAAEELARLYGITLVEYSYGVATFYTEEDPEAVIARGRENGWPVLSINGNMKAS